jgi:hypothetical protein
VVDGFVGSAKGKYDAVSVSVCFGIMFKAEADRDDESTPF